MGELGVRSRVPVDPFLVHDVWKEEGKCGMRNVV